MKFLTIIGAIAMAIAAFAAIGVGINTEREAFAHHGVEPSQPQRDACDSPSHPNRRGRSSGSCQLIDLHDSAARWSPAVVASYEVRTISRSADPNRDGTNDPSVKISFGAGRPTGAPTYANAVTVTAASARAACDSVSGAYQFREVDADGNVLRGWDYCSSQS